MKFFLVLSLVIFSCSKSPSITIKKEKTPLEKLINGNIRFVKGKSIHPDENLARIKSLKKGQNPFAIVVSCSDSRIPPELIFDQGLGDIFTIRTAGNIIGEYELGSIEYAVEKLHCNLVVVLGHENCGAIQSFIDSKNQRYHNHIQNILDYIANENEEKAIKNQLLEHPDRAIHANIKHGVNTLKNSQPVLKNLVEKNKVKIVGAYYDLDQGKVSFNHEECIK